MAGGRPGIEPGSLPYSNVLPCGRTASGGIPVLLGYPPIRDEIILHGMPPFPCSGTRP